MNLKFQLLDERSRFCIKMACEEFDGRPGLDELWFDGINEPVTADVAALVAWVLLAPFISQKVRFSEPVSRPLLNRIVSTWGAPLEAGPANDKPARFPARLGTLFVSSPGDTLSDVAEEKRDQPAYHLRELPLNASATSYVGSEIGIRTNASLLGQGLVPSTFAHFVGPALVYADFLGISDIVVAASAVDVPAPAKRLADVEPVRSWQELLKAAGFNLRVRA